MKKIRVHIENRFSYMDKDVYVTIRVPSVPNRGDFIFLSQKNHIKLEMLARKTPEISIRYFPLWFYGKSGKLDDFNFNDASLKDLSFADAILVKSVCYNMNNKTVSIELESG